MRFLKKLLICLLIYIGVYLPFVVVMQAIFGGDFTAAYSVGGIVTAVELTLSAVIKRAETKRKEKNENEDD